MITIRKAGVKDAAGMAKVHVDSWRETYQGIVPDDYLYNDMTYESREKNWQVILKEQTAFVAVDDNNNVVGFAGGGKERSGNYPSYGGELYAIYLLQEAQGNGSGRRLTEAVMQYLKENGYQSMLVWVLEENKTKYFYEKMGAEPVGSENIKIGGKDLRELAYGWKSLPVKKPVKDGHEMKNWQGAACICVNKYNELLMVKQGSPKEKKKWSVPSGGLEPGETFASCCLRELIEETGYRAEICKPLFIKCTKHNRYLIKVQYFEAEIVGGYAHIQDPDQLIHEIAWKSSEDIKKMVLSYPDDRKTLINYLLDERSKLS